MKTRPQKRQRAVGNTTLTISLPEDLKKRIESAAEEVNRSVSNYLVVELTAMLEAKGKAQYTGNSVNVSAALLTDAAASYGGGTSEPPKRKPA